MPNIVEVSYGQTGNSTRTNKFGMREMQEKAFAYRTAQYLLIKAPPASGKSRALMFIALDKLENQGLKKVIVAVPERSIGASFKKTDLKSNGFFADWVPDDRYNLCTSDADDNKSKIAKFVTFMHSTDPNDKILICTHATLRFAYEQLKSEDFNDCLVAIDEFHHVSADINNSKLGDLFHGLIVGSTAHIIAMTGSYFRGDGIAVMLPEDEYKFERVTYNYYEQLNGYKYLKSLGIGYHFYQGQYISALGEVLDTNKKTIIHIPYVNSQASTKDKYEEVSKIIDVIGDIDHEDTETGINYVKRKSDGKILKVADLVKEEGRDRVVNYLRNMKNEDDLDILIALGMAKEGFDWPYCEHTLTIGYRGSLTEVVQIIGRCTRDSENKTHAQFTNLIAEPAASGEQTTVAVQNMLKAITCSLLMEQVIAPKFDFKPRKGSDASDNKPGEIKVRGLKEVTDRVSKILETDLDDLKARVLQDTDIQKAIPGNIDPLIINKHLIPKIIRTAYPDLDDDEVDQIRQRVVADSAIKAGHIEQVGDKQFIRIANQFINIVDLDIDLIDAINPFQKAFEVLSKTLDKKMFKMIQDSIDTTRIKMTLDQARILWPQILEFRKSIGREPYYHSNDPKERELAEALLCLKDEIRKQKATK